MKCESLQFASKLKIIFFYNSKILKMIRVENLIKIVIKKIEFKLSD